MSTSLKIGTGSLILLLIALIFVDSAYVKDYTEYDFIIAITFMIVSIIGLYHGIKELIVRRLKGFIFGIAIN